MRKLKWAIVMSFLMVFVIYIVITVNKNYTSQEVEIETAVIMNEELLEVPITKQYTKYAVELSIDQNCHSFEGIAKVLYTHQYDRSTGKILINAGSIEIEDIQINSSIASFEQSGSTVMIQSPFEIKKDSEVTITIQFNGLFANNANNIKNSIGMVSACNFFPTISGYSEMYGWGRTNNEGIDNLRLLEPADYEVTIHTYKGQYPIGTGTLNDVSEKDNMITTSFSAKQVRGFGIVIGPSMEREVFNTQEGFSIVLYQAPGSSVGEKAIPMITKILNNYSDVLGEYPYDQLTIIYKDGMGEGVAYPTLIVGEFGKEPQVYNNINNLIGKQWLYYIIGSSKEAFWLNEGLLVYLNKRLSLSQGQMETYILEQKKIYEGKTTNDTNEIAIQMFYEIEKGIGKGAFENVLRAYYKDYSFHVSTGKEFINLINETTEIDVTSIYNHWLKKMELGESE